MDIPVKQARANTYSCQKDGESNTDDYRPIDGTDRYLTSN